MKLEMHAHSFKSSICATADNNYIIDSYLTEGYDGIIITNHLGKKFFDEYCPNGSYSEQIDAYLTFFDEFKELAEKKGLKVFLGAEVMLSDTNTEFMIMGFTREFLYQKVLYLLSQEELFRYCDDNGVLMYQTHPFRPGVSPKNPRYMHGAEAINGHFGYDNGNDLAKEFCKANNLIEFCGTDFHHENQPITTAIIVDDNIKNEFELVNAIKDRKYSLMTNENYNIKR